MNVRTRGEASDDTGRRPRTPFARRAADEGRAGRLPDFLVIGAMKAGTTSLFEYLAAHPQVFMPPLKEMDFFVRELNWRRGLGWYRRQFRGAGPEMTAVGEASPSYTKYPLYDGVAERIATHLPEARLIYLLRDPIERIRSHYDHRRLVGSEHDPIEVAVTRDPSYLDGSRYAMQIERYLQWFPRERMLIVTSEDLRSQREAAMRRIYGFIGADEDIRPDVLEQEFYRTTDRENYPSYVWWTRRNLKHLIPESQRWRVRRTVTQALALAERHGPSRAAKRRPPSPSVEVEGDAPVRTRISDELRRRVEGELAEDVMRLGRYLPAGFDGWGITNVSGGNHE